MATSPLDFANSDSFRKKLFTKNLNPYYKSPNRPSLPVDYEYVQSDLPVKDSPDNLIDEPTFANKLYPLNQWGSDGGYNEVADPGILKNTKSNQGEYGGVNQTGALLDTSVDESRKWKSVNAYSDSGGLIDSAESFSSLDVVVPNGGRGANGQPYPTYVPSTYNPLSILLFDDPQGSNGRLSEDSFIVRLGATTLREEFKERVAAQIRQQTIDRVNILNIRGGEDALSILSGRVPAIEPNWTISVPQNPVIAAADFALRLGGSILPISPIPGSYFDPTINPKQPTTLGQITNAFRKTGVGRVFNRLVGANNTGSELFFNNTGPGQRSTLFRNINYNRYKPNLSRSGIERVVSTLFDTVFDNSDYYVGSAISDPSRVFSPSGELPVNEFGMEIQSPVYGPDELSKMYDQSTEYLKLGPNGKSYINGGGVEGGLTWVSPKYKGNAGKKVGVGGQIYDNDSDFSQSTFTSTESTDREFRDGSILDDTQRLINSQPDGGRRLRHVGNAIDQVSKVFNDGYKEITKGSKVLSYVGEIGQEVGKEYCRVFTKDTPYLQYNDLQKSEGITQHGRKFSWSVLDSTYNLNIAPNRPEGGKSSSNIETNGIGGVNSYVKKYMFSLENLSWRTSRTPGYSYDDLPVCERGPNGGRVMWFPPYDLKFSENSSANWKQTDFIGRPEPIYTYNNTNRTGSISWKIVVDHPSILNVITNKVLGNESNRERVDSIIESFFAGCRKYDIYELAKKYNTISPNELYDIQTKLIKGNTTNEDITYIKETYQSGNNSTSNISQPIAQNTSTISFDGYKNIAAYFPNDYPKKGGNLNYDSDYQVYLDQQSEYVSIDKTLGIFFEMVIDSNFDKINRLIMEIKETLESNPNSEITIIVASSTSAPATETYNIELSERRITSLKNYIKQSLSDYVISGKLILKDGVAQGERTTVSNPITSDNSTMETFNCTDNDDTKKLSNEIYTIRAMACRRAYISDIIVKIDEDTENKQMETSITNLISDPEQFEFQTEKINQQTTGDRIETDRVIKDGISKKIIRSLISECDYFETIKEDSPMVFDSLKDKLKYFQPAFHSTTPEGLNSRLTFLQQCLRPGDTIPTIKNVEGDPEYDFTDSATNTSFGTPPVLVLRVGDFYNTKIIPDGIQIQYEGLDINPEGIGIQPMIANVTMNFKFIGGSGLKDSIDKLQNSLSFNYYANTEIWDERADATDDSYKVFDTELVNSIESTPPPTINQTQSNLGKDNGSTIGEVLSRDFGDNETGEISYSSFMDGVVNDTQNYYRTIINKNEEIILKYNNAVKQQIMAERNYTKGNFNVSPEDDVHLFGKPSGLDNRISKISDQLIKDIKDGNEGFITFLKKPSVNFSNKLLRIVENNYINFIETRTINFQNELSGVIQDMVLYQNKYIGTLSRLDSITFKTDGFQLKNGNVKVYNLLGTNGIYDELVQDTIKIKDDLILFNKISEDETSFKYNNISYSQSFVLPVNTFGKSSLIIDEVFNNFTEGLSDVILKRVYFILSKMITDDKNYQSFKNQLIGDILRSNITDKKENQRIEEVFDNYWIKTVLPIFVEEDTLSREFIKKFRDDSKDFINYIPFPTKERKMEFSSEITDQPKLPIQEKLIRGLGSSKNINTNILTWNDNIGNGTNKVFLSKSKLN